MSAWASVNGTTIYRGSFFMPWYGRWALDADLVLPNTASGSLSVTIGNLNLVGFAYRTDNFAGVTSVRGFAGAGGWDKTLEPRAINSQPVSLSNVLQTTAQEVGETVNVQNDGGVGNFYIRPQGVASNVLRNLCPLWWIDNSGVTQVANTRPSTAISSTFVVEHFNPGTGVATIATEDIASWVPGNTFTGPTVPNVRTIQGVRIRLNNEGTPRLEVLSN
jgi:hypothetical protein